jgi:acyl-coenzyme A synthetase/AMP-(fatty) acid ligase
MALDFLKNYSGTAVICNEHSYSFDELNSKISFYKERLNKYSRKVISIVSEFNFDSISLLLAISSTNNIAVPLVYTSEDELQKKIKTSNTNIIFKYDKINSLFLEEEILVESYLDLEPGIILFSSGTTGIPKMMCHDFSNLFKVFDKPSKRQREIRILLFLMFDHIGGINTLLNSIKDGSVIVIPESRTPDYIIDLIYKYNINILPTTPTFLNLMLINLNDNFEKLKSLKLISYGTERMPEQILLKLKKGLNHVKLLQTFGTSETGILRTESKSSESLFFRIVDDRYSYKILNNILFIKSIMNVNGYLNQDSDKFDNEGWYNTGDIVKIDDDGFLTVIGRINEVINIGGLKVMPVEIENTLLEFNGILDCMVYGEFNALTGQMVTAKIVLDSKFFVNLSEIEIKKLVKNYCKQKLDKFKIPAKIHIVQNIEFTGRFKKVLS